MSIVYVKIEVGLNCRSILTELSCVNYVKKCVVMSLFCYMRLHFQTIVQIIMYSVKIFGGANSHYKCQHT